MSSLGSALLVAMPLFYILILIEICWAVFVKGHEVNIIDSISSVSSGFTNILKSTLGLSIAVVSYPWLKEHVGLIHWEHNGAAAYIITFITMDFVYYWMHRLSHSVNFFWNHHVIHHSSEEFNLPCALRQNITMVTNITSISLLPVAMLGIEYSVLLIVAPIHFFSQFWYHTRYIKKMGFLEHILVTPSHHRVHHAMNDQYMDKNYSAIFIVWDKLFGTYQDELESEPCVFGMRRPAQSWNPFIVSFKHYWLLITDAWRTKNWLDKLRIWFMPTGWRPADVAEKHPVFTIKSMDELKKYTPTYSKAFVAFSFVHINVLFALLYFLFSRYGSIERADALTYGFILFASVFGFTSILDKKDMGLIGQILVAIYAVGHCYITGDWFGLNAIIPYGSALVSIYFLISTFILVLYYYTELKPSAQKIALPENG